MCPVLSKPCQLGPLTNHEALAHEDPGGRAALTPLRCPCPMPPCRSGGSDKDSDAAGVALAVAVAALVCLLLAVGGLAVIFLGPGGRASHRKFDNEA